MDAPNPDSGEEYFHTNVQLFNAVEEQNRFKTGEASVCSTTGSARCPRRRS
jgi:hypothetical protein